MDNKDLGRIASGDRAGRASPEPASSLGHLATIPCAERPPVGSEYAYAYPPAKRSTDTAYTLFFYRVTEHTHTGFALEPLRSERYRVEQWCPFLNELWAVPPQAVRGYPMPEDEAAILRGVETGFLRATTAIATEAGTAET